MNIKTYINSILADIDSDMIAISSQLQKTQISKVYAIVANYTRNSKKIDEFDCLQMSFIFMMVNEDFIIEDCENLTNESNELNEENLTNESNEINEENIINEFLFHLDQPTEAPTDTTETEEQYNIEDIHINKISLINGVSIDPEK